MEYLFLSILLLAGLAWLALPFLRGSGYIAEMPEKSMTQTAFTEKLSPQPDQRHQTEVLSDRIESLKLALRDMDMENRIGKISHSDFEILRHEMLAEWKEAEDELKQVSGKETGLENLKEDSK